jgi:hypothetical protein
LGRFALATALVLALAGCRGILTTAMYLVKGNNIEAAFDGLKGKKVAVVCRPMTSLEYRDAHAAKDIARTVGVNLRTNVSKIEVIDQSEVSKWADEHTWTDYAEVGKGLGADMVVGIDLLSFSLLEGQTLYQGKANAAVRVFDCTNGKLVYEKELPPSLYPPNTGIETMAMEEREFRAKFIRVLADQIGRHFYAHDAYADYAMDATVLD